jgi:hypothetical protein
MGKKLSVANTYLRDSTTRENGLWTSAKTSSAIEGIRQPFAEKGRSATFPTAKALTDHWKKRSSTSGR